jgi:hypothetical protein
MEGRGRKSEKPSTKITGQLPYTGLNPTWTPTNQRPASDPATSVAAHDGVHTSSADMVNRFRGVERGSVFFQSIWGRGKWKEEGVSQPRMRLPLFSRARVHVGLLTPPNGQILKRLLT